MRRNTRSSCRTRGLKPLSQTRVGPGRRGGGARAFLGSNHRPDLVLGLISLSGETRGKAHSPRLLPSPARALALRSRRHRGRCAMRRRVRPPAPTGTPPASCRHRTVPAAGHVAAWGTRTGTSWVTSDPDGLAGGCADARADRGLRSRPSAGRRERSEAGKLGSCGRQAARRVKRN